jgi:hypothetical protein
MTEPNELKNIGPGDDDYGRRKSPSDEAGTRKKELKPANQNPEFGKVCKHGSLARKCYICELEEDIDRLTKERDLAREMLLADKTHEPCRIFEENRKKEIVRLKEDCAHLEMDNFSLRKENQEYRNGHLVMSDLDKLKESNRKYRNALENIMSFAGHPDPKDGCRNVINHAKEALQGVPDEAKHEG